MAARGKSTRGSGGRKTEATPEHPPLELVVGFDAEWVNANRADDSLPTSDNVLISWQLAVVLPNGKLLSRIFYAEGDTRRHRLSLIKMLSKALFDAWQNGDIKALPPAWRITIAGHFLRADLTTVREFPKLKTRVELCPQDLHDRNQASCSDSLRQEGDDLFRGHAAAVAARLITQEARRGHWPTKGRITGWCN